MLNARGRAVQDAQVVGPRAAVVGGGAVVPHHHHLLGALEAPDRAHMALAAVLLPPLPVRAADYPRPDPFHHHPVIPGVTHRGPSGGLRCSRRRRRCRRRGPRERVGPGPASRRRRGRQRAAGNVGVTLGGGGAIPAEPTAAPQPSPSPPPPPPPRPRSDWTPDRSDWEAAAGGRRGGRRGRGLLRFLPAPDRATATAARKPRSPPAGSAGSAGSRVKLTRGGRRGRRGASLTAGLFAPPAPRFGWAPEDRAAASPRAAVVPPGGRRAPQPRGPGSQPHARRRAPPSHGVPSGRQRLHIRVLAPPRPEQHLLSATRRGVLKNSGVGKALEGRATRERKEREIDP